MKPHPCAGHACDHCATCDNLGICCASVTTPVATVVMTAKPDNGSLTDLRAALTEDAQASWTTTSNLRLLVTQPNPAIVPTAVSSLTGLHTPHDRPALPTPAIDLVLQSLRTVKDSRHLELVRHAQEGRS